MKIRHRARRLKRRPFRMSMALFLRNVWTPELTARLAANVEKNNALLRRLREVL